MARILHAEDDRYWREIVRTRLLDHDVESAASFEEAIQYVRTRPAYDVALVDLNLMNDRDGLGKDVLELLRATHPATRRILVTGGPLRGSMRLALSAGFDVDDIIFKGDMDTPDLRAVIEGAASPQQTTEEDPLKLRRSALRQRFRDWQRVQADRLRTDLRVAEEHLYDAGRVSGQTRRRAQVAVNDARARETEFRDICARLRRLMTDIESPESLDAALESLDAAEERFGEGGSDEAPGAETAASEGTQS